MSGYTTSPTLSAVLRDLEDTERHRACFAYTWKYDAGTFECSMCGVERQNISSIWDNGFTEGESVNAIESRSLGRRTHPTRPGLVRLEGESR